MRLSATINCPTNGNNLKAYLIIYPFAIELNKKKAVVFFDEFQEIGKLQLSKSIEAAIRSVAESTQHISFLFSGSNRRLLERLFSDDTRPLYSLCDQIKLSKISADHYKKFISDYALETWGSDFNSASYDLLFELTERHLYYVNAFCQLI